jgi:hypothetical protein
MKEKAKHLPRVSERGGKQHWRRHDEFFNESLLAHLHTQNTHSHACKLALQAQTMAIIAYIIIGPPTHAALQRVTKLYPHFNTHRFLLQCCEVGAHWEWVDEWSKWLITYRRSVLVTIQVASGNPSGKELQAIPTTWCQNTSLWYEKVQLWVISLALCLASSSGE